MEPSSFIGPFSTEKLPECEWIPCPYLDTVCPQGYSLFGVCLWYHNPENIWAEVGCSWLSHSWENPKTHRKRNAMNNDKHFQRKVIGSLNTL